MKKGIKILLLIMVAFSVAGCELFDLKVGEKHVKI